jgi:hypothetical protein
LFKKDFVTHDGVDCTAGNLYPNIGKEMYDDDFAPYYIIDNYGIPHFFDKESEGEYFDVISIPGILNTGGVIEKYKNIILILSNIKASKMGIIPTNLTSASEKAMWLFLIHEIESGIGQKLECIKENEHYEG